MSSKKKQKKKQQKQKKQQQHRKIQFTPENESYYCELLTASINQNKFRQAAIELKNVLKCNPNADLTKEKIAIHILRGNSFLDSKNHQSSWDEFKAALIIDPQNITTIKALAGYYINSEQITKGYEWLKNLFDNNELPKDSSVLYIKFLMLLDHWDQIEKIISNHKSRFWAADIHWAKGVLLFKADKFQEAMKSFNKAKKNNQWLHQAYAWSLWSRIKSSDENFGYGYLDRVQSENVKIELEKEYYIKYDVPLHGWFNLGYKKDNTTELYSDIKKKNWQNVAQAHDRGKIKPGSFVNKPQILAKIYFLAAEDEYRNEKDNRFFNYMNKALSYQPDNLNYHIKACLLTATIPEKKSLAFFQRTELLIKQKARENSQNWSKEQIEYYLAELDIIQAKIHYSLDNKKKFKELCLKAEQLAIVSPHAYFALYKFYNEMQNNDNKAIFYLEKMFEIKRYSDVTYDNLKSLYSKNNYQDKLLKLREKYGKEFDDEIIPDQTLRLYLGNALSSKDSEYLDEIYQERMEKNHPLDPLVEFIIDLFDENYDLAKRQKANVNEKKLDSIFNSTLANLKPDSFFKPLVYELTILALNGFNLKTKAKKMLNQWEKILQSKTDSKTHYKSYFIVQCILNKPEKHIEAELAKLLRKFAQPLNHLIELQMVLYSYGHYGTLRKNLKEPLDKDPENPGLLLAYATSFSENSTDHDIYFQKGLKLAGKLQDTEVLNYYKTIKEMRKIADKYAHDDFSFGDNSFDFFGSIAGGDVSFLEDMIKGTMPKDLKKEFASNNENRKIFDEILNDPKLLKDFSKDFGIPEQIAKVILNMMKQEML